MAYYISLCFINKHTLILLRCHFQKEIIKINVLPHGIPHGLLKISITKTEQQLNHFLLLWFGRTSIQYNPSIMVKSV